MTGKKRKPRSPGRKTPKSSSPASRSHPSLPAPAGLDDEAALEAFCAGIHLEETSFESWQDTHESLDITMPLFLSRAEAAAGTTRQLSFVRCAGKAREKAGCEIVIPPETADGSVILLEKLGDRRGERLGDLKVIIRLKS